MGARTASILQLEVQGAGDIVKGRTRNSYISPSKLDLRKRQQGVLVDWVLGIVKREGVAMTTSEPELPFFPLAAVMPMKSLQLGPEVPWSLETSLAQ